jgi:hypothetical protein
MRDPAVTIDPNKAALEEATQFLKRQNLRADSLSRKATERFWSAWPNVAQFRPGRSRPTQHGRDGAIAVAVLLMVARGYKPTRNSEKHGKPENPSACAIVARALRRLRHPVTESAVEKVWQRHRMFYPRLESFRRIRLVSYDSGLP